MKSDFMKSMSLVLLLCAIFISPKSYAQYDTLPIPPSVKKSRVKPLIVPFSLLTAGVLLSNGSFEKDIQYRSRKMAGNDFRVEIDDYTRYIPIAELYIADALGVKAKNHWFDQTKNLAVTLIVTDFITGKLKQGTNKARPEGGSRKTSFPSSHTSLAFAGATVLFKEFRETSPWLAYSGYGIAAATGILRIMNNKHWTADVLVGAGIGMLVGEIVYMFDPIIKWNPFLKTKDITVLPMIDEGHYGMYVGIKF